MKTSSLVISIRPNTATGPVSRLDAWAAFRICRLRGKWMASNDQMTTLTKIYRLAFATVRTHHEAVAAEIYWSWAMHFCRRIRTASSLDGPMDDASSF